MKKFIKLFGLAFITFLVAFNVNAGVCDGVSARDIITVTPYNPTGWNAWAYVCRYTNCREKFTSCDMGTREDAKDWCRGTYQQPGYKNYNHTVSVGQCADSRVCTCATCTTTCNITTKVYKWKTVSCDEGTADCVCVSTKGPQINEAIMNDGGGGGGNSSTETEPEKTCTKSYWSLQSSTPSSVSIVESYGGDSCSSDADKQTLKDAATKTAETACADKAGTTISGEYKTVVEVGSKSTDCDDSYRVKYNVCDCAAQPYEVKNVREAKYKTKGDDGDDIAVYCINPADEPPGKTQVKGFDATQCESSNSTPECGFSNILIEGYYRRNIKNNGNYSYAVVGAAMRLWSAHVGNSGFKDTGIADEDDSTINSDGSWLHFVPGPEIKGPYLNVFKATLEHFHKDYKYRNVKTVYEVDTITGNGTSNLVNIACSKDNMGIFCSGDTGNYLYALALYANTVQGNKYMQQHLNEINFNNDPEVLEVVKNDPVSYTTTILSDTKVQITYKLRENVEVDCSTLPDELKNTNACKIEQQAIVKDKYNNVLGTANITEYDYCRKNYCYTTVEFTPGTLNCNVIDKFVLKTEVYKTCGASSVKSYYACSNPDKHQIMYSFEPDQNCDENPKTTEYMESSFKCNLCEDDADSDVKACSGTAPVTNSVFDPSLNCILHKSSGNKEGTTKTPKHAYDYSDTFKVNTDICRVYCSDKVTYKVSGKKKVSNSFQLSYDIKKDLGITNNDSNKLVSIIEMERNCVSEIFYDKIKFDYVKDWSKAYGLNDETINNWKTLYNALAKKSKDENERQELLNKLAYDLYNCNFYTDAQISAVVGDAIKKPLDSVNAYSTAKKLLENTVQYCNDNECVSGYIKYDGGAEFIHPVSEAEQRVGSSERNPYLTSNTNIHTSSINVLYCTEDKCFREDKSAPKGKEFSAEDFGNAEPSSKLSTGNIQVLDVKVPENDYAIFSMKVSNDVYNPVLYQVQQGTGKVQVEKEADKDKYYTLKKNTFPISSYAYSLCDHEKGASSATCKVNHQYFIPVYAEFKNSVGAKQLLFSRNFTDDNFLEKLAEANQYTCSYLVEDLGKSGGCPPNVDCGNREGYIFRNIDLANPVPVEREGTNWDAHNVNNPKYSSYVGGVINEIKDSADNNLYATDYYLEYSFVLDATSIEEIRSNNKVSNYFALPNSCKLINDKNDPLYNTYSGCKSAFLNDVRASHKYSIIVNKADGVSQYTKDKDKVGGGN